MHNFAQVMHQVKYCPATGVNSQVKKSKMVTGIRSSGLQVTPRGWGGEGGGGEGGGWGAGGGTVSRINFNSALHTSQGWFFSRKILLSGCPQSTPETALPNRQSGILSQVSIQVLEGVTPKACWATQHVKGLEGAVEAIISWHFRHRGALDG